MEEPGWSRDRSKATSTEEAKVQLAIIRKRIDELDRLTSQLLAERLTLASQLPSIKSKLGVPIQDAKREADVLSSIVDSIDDNNTAQAIKSVYHTVIEQSLRVQQAELFNQTLESVEHIARKAPREKNDKLPRKPIYFPRVHIVGLGLIGGMLARLIKSSIPQTIVSAEDKAEILANALLEGVIDIGDIDSAGSIERASLVILAATPTENLKLLRKLTPKLRRRQLIIDVASTKQQICELSEILDLRGADFIGGHPLFGSERSGYSASRSINPQGKTFCVVPTKRSSEMALRRLCRWLSMLNLKVKIIDAPTHDAHMAKLSHIVQLLAVTLGAELADGIADDELSEVLSLSGTSFTQFSRLMASPAQLWTDIIGQNKSQLSKTLNNFAKRLDALSGAIKIGDDTTIEQVFKKAHRIPHCLSQIPYQQNNKEA